MTETPLPILYSFRRCPYAMRARLAVAASGMVVELREIVLRDKPAAMLAASPKGTVPVLVLPGGDVIDESVDIMRWALRMRDPEAWLDGDSDAIVATNDGAFKHHLDRYKYADRHDPDARDDHRAAATEILATLDQRLATHANLLRDHRSLADMAVFPFVRQFAETDRTYFDSLPLPALQRWLAGHLASPLFAQVMLRVPPWREGDPEVRFPTSLPSAR